MKNKIFLAVLILITALTLILAACGSTNPDSKTTSGTDSIFQDRLATIEKDIGTLTAKINAISQNPNTDRDTIAKLQTQVSNLANNYNNMLTKLDKHIKEMDSSSIITQLSNLQEAVNRLEKTQSSSVSIGKKSVTLDGLSITYIIKSLHFETIGPSALSTGIFAVKVANTGSTTINNVDIVGKVEFSDELDDIVPGLPTIACPGGIVNYNGNYDGEDTLTFEAYNWVNNRAVTNISIASGSSYTFRPRIALQAKPDESMRDITSTISLISIHYDR
jgi:hypothetical protein